MTLQHFFLVVLDYSDYEFKIRGKLLLINVLFVNRLPSVETPLDVGKRVLRLDGIRRLGPSAFQVLPVVRGACEVLRQQRFHCRGEIFAMNLQCAINCVPQPALPPSVCLSGPLDWKSALDTRNKTLDRKRRGDS